MIILSYGYEKPQNTDTGDIYFPAMERNIQRLNDHNHNGIDSAPISMTTILIDSTNWTVSTLGEGLYEQTVSMPTGFDYDDFLMDFRLSTGEVVYPYVERVTGSSFKLFTNDNTLDYVCKLK